MVATYSGGIAEEPTYGTNLSDTETHLFHHQRIWEELRAVEQTLGINPQGGAATVVARLDAIGSISSYTPTLGGTGWSLGTTGAQAFGMYSRVGSIVVFSARLIFGTDGETFGSVAATVSLPVSANSDFVNTAPYASAHSELRDTSASFVFTGAAEITAGAVAPGCYTTESGFQRFTHVTDSAPFTWDETDEIRVAGWYRAAS